MNRYIEVGAAVYVVANPLERGEIVKTDEGEACVKIAGFDKPMWYRFDELELDDYE